MAKPSLQEPALKPRRKRQRKTSRNAKATRASATRPLGKMSSLRKKTGWQRLCESLQVYRRDLLRSLAIHVLLMILLSWWLVPLPENPQYLGPLEMSFSESLGEDEIQTVMVASAPPAIDDVVTPPNASGEQPSPEPNSKAGIADGNGPADGTADEFSRRRQAAGGKQGDVTITLIFDDISDLDIHVYDPAGEHIYYSHPQTASGAFLDVDRNARPPLSDQAVENVYWGTGEAPVGHYRIGVKLYNRRGAGEILFRVKVQVFQETRIYEGRFPAEMRGGGSSPLAPICALELTADQQVVWRTPDEYLAERHTLAQKQQQDERAAAAQWRRADSQVRRGRLTDAKQILKRLVERWPGTESGKRAQQTLENWQQLLAKRRRRRR